MTMNAVAFDIMTLLNDNIAGLTTAQNLFANMWGHLNGQEIDQQLLVVDSEGITSPLKDAWEQPVFQILTRGNKGADTLDAYNVMREVHEFLISQPEVVLINGCQYLGFEPQGTIAPLGRDENDRMVYSMRYYSYRNPI